MIAIASHLVALSLAVAPAPPTPPASVTAFLLALGSHDLAAARATLSRDVQFMDRGRAVRLGALESFAAYVEGCRQTELSWSFDDEDQTRGAGTVTWTCPSRGATEVFIWTAGARVVAVVFGLPPS